MNLNPCTYIDYAAAAKQREEWRAWLQAKAAERRAAEPFFPDPIPEPPF